MKQTTTIIPQLQRRRKFLMVLPLLALPFMYTVFGVLGGGKGPGNNQKDSTAGKGFNQTLPGAHFAKNDTAMDKMGFYRRADEDSAAKMEKIKEDPYHGKNSVVGAAPIASPAAQQADELLGKLATLKTTLRQPATSYPAVSPPALRTFPDISPSAPDRQSAPDPQIERLNELLDKAYRIEHPVKYPTAGADTIAAPKLLVLPAAVANETQTVPELETPDTPVADSNLEPPGGFYTVGEEAGADTLLQNIIPAVIEEDETLVSGSTVTLRLTAASRIAGAELPKDMLVYGLASINGDRMHITVNSIRLGRSIYPVALQVYDLDGLAGIHIPGLVSRDVAKQSAGDGIGSVDLGSFDPSLGAQVANAGIQAGKTLLSKKVKQVRVSVRAGYQVLLKNTETTHK